MGAFPKSHEKWLSDQTMIILGCLGEKKQCEDSFCLHHNAFCKEEVLPLRLKNSREYFPDRAKCLGILPRSSMMCAMWSMEERKRSEGVRKTKEEQNEIRGGK